VHFDSLQRRLFPLVSDTSRVVEWWMPPALRGRTDREANRMRIFVHNAVLALLLLVVLVVVSIPIGQWSHAAFGAGFIAIEAVVLTLSRHGRSRLATTVQFCAMLLGVGFKSWTMGPMLMAVWVWSPLVPMTALAIGGARSALRWTVFAAVTFLAVMALHAVGVVPAVRSRVDGLLLVATGLGMLLATIGIAGAFERDMSAALDDAESRALALERARVDLEARNRSLVEAQGRLEALNRELAVARDAAELGGRARSDFLAVMSHEVRTPMNAVIGMTTLLLDTGLTDEQRSFIETIRASGDALLTLLNDALDYSKIEAGRVELESLAFDPALEVRQVVDLMRGAANARGNTLRLTAAEGLPACVRSDPGRIRQVLLNLVSNAVKFTRDGHVEVRVAAEPADGRVWLRVEVRDTGIGMGPAALSQLFKPFTQADASTTRRFGGTGLGLAISHRIATLLGGKIAVSSEPGLGSAFTLRVPVEPVAPVVESARRQTVQGHGQRLRVLVAEDNAVNQKVITLMLERMGHRVDAVGNGAEAVEALARAPYDVVLMDVQMPELDGIAATQMIRARESARRTPIIALTANVFDDDVRRCRDAGMDDFIGKPVRRELLVAALSRFGASPRVTVQTPPSMPPPRN
jgi:signal transduction histidine kinase/ActR/RegA family two-component response regulator